MPHPQSHIAVTLLEPRADTRRNHRVGYLWKPRWRWIAIKRMGSWGALAAALAWPLSLVGGVTFIFPGGFRIAAHGGSLNLGCMSPADPSYPPGAYTYANAGALWLLPSLSSYSTVFWGAAQTRVDITIPFWLIALTMGAAGGLGVLKCRPPREGRCRKCGYELVGITGAERCPECGWVIDRNH